jgi:hypothetical protein
MRSVRGDVFGSSFTVPGTPEKYVYLFMRSWYSPREVMKYRERRETGYSESLRHKAMHIEVLGRGSFGET